MRAQRIYVSTQRRNKKNTYNVEAYWDVTPNIRDVIFTGTKAECDSFVKSIGEKVAK